jgi:Zn-dependent oligopeptidase
VCCSDSQVVRQYFPLQIVVDGTLVLYQRLLGLQFSLVHNPHTWHPVCFHRIMSFTSLLLHIDCLVVVSAFTQDAVLYAVHEAADPTKLVGYFFFDIYLRVGKYSQTACFPLQPAWCVFILVLSLLLFVFILSLHPFLYFTAIGLLFWYHSVDHQGKWQVPVVAFLANHAKPDAGKPVLLSHPEVITLVHEFGHVMHHVRNSCVNPLFPRMRFVDQHLYQTTISPYQICSLTRFARFSGTQVEKDFVEIPRYFWLV